jgi:hypothetical protein
MSLIEPRKVKTKSELVQVLANTMIEFVGEHDASDEMGLRRVTKDVKTLIRNKKSVHVVLLEKKRSNQ